MGKEDLPPWERNEEELKESEEVEVEEVDVPPWEAGSEVEEVDVAPWETISDEMHPKLDNLRGYLTRALYKNFGGKGIDFLKKEYPDLEWRKTKDNEIITRSPDENTWYKLDPSHYSLKELALDSADIGYDIPAGLAQGLITAKAALAAGVASGGVASVPAAMAASGLTAAGSEALRQKIGKLLGTYDEDMDLSDIATAGTIGAVIPAGLGTGVVKSEAIKYAAKKGLTKNAAEELAKMQSGYLRRHIAPLTGQFISGTPKSLITKAKELLPILSKEGGAEEAIAFRMQELREKATDSLKEIQNNFGKKIEEILNKTDNEIARINKAGAKQNEKYIPIGINTEKVISPLLNLKTALKEKSIDSPETQSILNSIDEVIGSVFYEQKIIKRKIKDEKTKKIKTVLEKRWVLPDILPINKAWQAYHQLESKLGSFGGDLSLSKQVGGIAQNASSAIDKQIIGKIGETRKEIKNEIEGKIKSLLGTKELKKYHALNEGFRLIKEFQNEVKESLRDPFEFYSFVANAHKNPIKKENLKKLSKLMKVDLTNEAITIRALNEFGKKLKGEDALGKKFGLGNALKTPLAALSGLIGWAAARRAGGEIAPSVAAAKLSSELGLKASSHPILRKYMELGEQGAKITQPIIRYAPQTITYGLQQIPPEVYEFFNLKPIEEK